MKKFTYLILFLVLTSQYCFTQWTSVTTSAPSGCMIASGNDYFGASGNNLMYSSNGGVNWTSTSLSGVGAVRSLAVKSNIIFAGIGFTSGNGVYMSTNTGVNWTRVLIANEPMAILVANSTDIYAATGLGVYLSTNNGSSWTQTALTTTQTFLATDGVAVYAGNDGSTFGTSKGLQRTLNRGASWTCIGFDSVYVGYIAATSSTIYCGSYHSTDNGLSWILSSFVHPNEKVQRMLVINNNVIAKTNFGRVYVTKNNGSTWGNKTDNLPISGYVSDLIEMLYASNYIYTLGNGAALYNRSYSDIIGIQKISSEVPEKYSLFQNYPNPFNPVTTINFQIPKEQLITLKIYDALGKEIETLVNEKLNPGSYNVNWNAVKYSSGVYYYKLETERFSDVKKMILIK